MRLNYQILSPISETSELNGMKNFAIKNLTAYYRGTAYYPTCCPLVRFSHIGSIEDAARDGPCAHGKTAYYRGAY